MRITFAVSRSDRSLPSILGTLLLCGVTACAPGAESAAARVVEATTADGAVVGSVELVGSCGEEVDPLVARGIALLHNMTYPEAAVAFGQAAEAEPECSVAHWGRAMAYVHPLWPDVVSGQDLVTGREHLDLARAASMRTARDDAFVVALDGYFADAENRSEPDRLAGFEAGWEAAHTAMPDDAEVTAFYALSLLATATPDPAYPHQNRAGELLGGVLERIPGHPGGQHYTIHAFDFPPLADRALDTAHTYGELAPANAHALHMTSHIFTRLGLWEQSIVFNRRSADAAAAVPMGDRVSYHYLHALDYLVYAYLQQGDDEAADAAAAEVANLGPVYDAVVSGYTVAAAPVRLALERENWEAAAALGEPEREELSWSQYPQLVAMPVFGQALGAAHTGDLPSARAAVERLAELRDAAAALPGSYDWGTQVEIQRLAASAWLQRAEGDVEGALQTATAAADLESTTEKHPVTPGVVKPARELLGDMLLAEGRAAEALAQYALSLEDAPNRFLSLAGAARAAREAGDSDAAANYAAQLLELARGSTRPQLVELTGAAGDD